MMSQRIISVFTEDSDLKFSEILTRYGIEASFNSSPNKKPSKPFIIKKAIRALLNNIISEDDFLAILEKITKDKNKAESLFKEITQQVLPLIEKVPEDKLDEYNAREDKAVTPTENKDIQTPAKEVVMKKIAQQPSKAPQGQPQPQQNRSADKYREPVT